MKFDLKNLEGFDWDEGNEDKNYLRHGVSKKECEEIFLNIPLNFYIDQKHSGAEIRYGVFGRTNENRLLFVVFTVRNNHVRVISARDCDKKERKEYEKQKNKTYT